MAKYFFMDMDNTICESRQKISVEMKDRLSKIDFLIVIGGLNKERMLYQLDGLSCIILAQSGNDAPNWQNNLTSEEIMEIFTHIEKIKTLCQPYNDEVKVIENRGCQVSLSFVGHTAPPEFKQKFDPDKLTRKSILKKHPFESKTLTCNIAGTTCLDYTSKLGDKGHNIKRYIKENKLDKDDCVFFGDALFEGGNDESVKGIIKTVEVANPQDLLLKLKEYV